MGSKQFHELCIRLVEDYHNTHKYAIDPEITSSDVYIVWSCKTLQNNKALVSTNVADGMYYEITFNGDKNEVYLYAYKKWENICIKMKK